jgi:uncharacterized protein (TIGR00730 family)
MNSKIQERPRKVGQQETLNLEKLNEAINNRLHVINQEFTDGLNFVKKHSKSVTFFGSARTLDNEYYYIKARELAYKICKEINYAIITGGGPGIMEAGNRGACEAGGDSLGLTIKLPMEQVTNPYLTEHMDFNYFFSRKVSMSFSAEAYVYFPGGFGTLDEFFEILTLIQTEKVEPTPIILFGKKYWGALDKYIKKHLLKGEKIDAKDRDLYVITEDLDEIVEIIKNAPVRTEVN